MLPGIRLEIGKQLAVGELRRHLPLRLQRSQGLLGRPDVGRSYADEIAVAYHRHLRELLCRLIIK